MYELRLLFQQLLGLWEHLQRVDFTLVSGCGFFVFILESAPVVLCSIADG